MSYNEQETRFFLIDPVLRDKGYNDHQWLKMETPAPVEPTDTPGITSPDYVALQGKEGVAESRWFYHWLRSPLGEQCILSLARGAVRERMLFNRLTEGEIELPDFAIQKKASEALAALRPMRQAIEFKINDIKLLPRKILAKAFGAAQP